MMSFYGTAIIVVFWGIAEVADKPMQVFYGAIATRGSSLHPFLWIQSLKLSYREGTRLSNIIILKNKGREKKIWLSSLN